MRPLTLHLISSDRLNELSNPCHYALKRDGQVVAHVAKMAGDVGKIYPEKDGAIDLSTDGPRLLDV